MKPKPQSNQPELSRPLSIDKVPAAGIEETIVASDKERAALAARFGLLEIKKLDAFLNVMHTRGNTMFAVKGRMSADVVQQCVVSLEPLPAKIEQAIDVLYIAAEFLENAGSNPHLDVEDEETEAILNGMIDLGELVAQNLGISLNPYPRKDGLPFLEARFGKPAVAENPFAKLAVLKTKKPKGD